MMKVSDKITVKVEEDIENETRELICINCPLGCSLIVTLEEGTVKKVEGIPVKKGKPTKERGDQPHQDRHFLCTGERGHASGGFC